MYSPNADFIKGVDNVDILVFAQSCNIWAPVKSIREPPVLFGVIRVVEIILKSKCFVI
jgi:hypothetical protein